MDFLSRRYSDERPLFSQLERTSGLGFMPLARFSPVVM